jgi:short-subunit dehydrogenase
MCGLLQNKYKTAFVTGVSSGLGEAFARMLLKEGVKVWGSSREAGKLESLKKEFSPLFTPVVLDLAFSLDALKAFKAAEAEAGAFDLVIQNAGYGVFGLFETISIKDWTLQLDQMLGVSVSLSHAAWSTFKKRNKGTLVHVSSLAAEFPLPFMSGYNIVKAGLSALSESLMYEAQGSRVIMIDFRPGDYKTAFNHAIKSAHISPTQESARLVAAWSALEKNLTEAPHPDKAARDLRKALLRGESGSVRSGGFFQASLAPFFARLLPKSLLRALTASYFN